MPKCGHEILVRGAQCAKPSTRTAAAVHVQRRTAGKKNARGRLRERIDAVRAFAATIDVTDPYAKTHSRNVSNYAEAIATLLGLPLSRIESIKAAALLHDVGKIVVPHAILVKPGPLTDEEFEAIKRHPAAAMDILAPIGFPSDERRLILHHHERYDGAGYPDGLSGERIPLGARVLSVADALDVMLSPRCYKGPYSLDRVRSELRAGAGRQFDPTVAEAALEWLACLPALFGLGDRRPGSMPPSIPIEATDATSARLASDGAPQLAPSTKRTRVPT